MSGISPEELAKLEAKEREIVKNAASTLLDRLLLLPLDAPWELSSEEKILVTNVLHKISFAR
jgi:hypothetical protein